VTARHADGRTTDVRYDFLINATGPALRFDKTPGLGPDGHSLSVCQPGHAVQAAAALDEEVERMRRGEHRNFLVCVGHGTCTCAGAAFEYIVNLEFELRHHLFLHKARLRPGWRLIPE
jgi:sulfide:quinone oxidoreductase